MAMIGPKSCNCRRPCSRLPNPRSSLSSHFKLLHLSFNSVTGRSVLFVLLLQTAIHQYSSFFSRPSNRQPHQTTTPDRRGWLIFSFPAGKHPASKMTSTTTTTAAAPTATHPTVDNQNFANNVFSDFAPLLTLFGDEITKQFLSTSTEWADNILLGTAPIGIMTVIICTIRIGGNRFLKSFIGRCVVTVDCHQAFMLSYYRL